MKKSATLGPALDRVKQSAVMRPIKTVVPVDLKTGVVGTNGKPHLTALLPEHGEDLLHVARKHKLSLKVGMHERGGAVSVVAERGEAGADGFYHLYTGDFTRNDETLLPFAPPKASGGRFYSDHDRQLRGIA